MTREFDADRCCGAKTRAGTACALSKGHSTDHPGSGNCWLHGGRTPNGRKHAQHEAAEKALTNALATLRIVDSLDPTEALLEALRVACWREFGLRQMVMGRTALFGPDHQGDQRPDVVAVMHHDALDARAKIAKMAIDAGVSSAFVRIAERQAEVTVRAVQAAIDALIASGDRQVAEAAAAAVLEATVPVGAGLN